MERLLTDLAPLQGRIRLVSDDVPELGSEAARRQLESLLLRAPDTPRFVLAARHDLRLGLHRLRLAVLSLAGLLGPGRWPPG